MTSLLDAIRARNAPVAQEPEPLVVPAGSVEPSNPYVLEIDPAEWDAWRAAPVEAGMGDDYCPWEETAPGEYRHVVTGQTYTCWQPYVLPNSNG